MLRTFVLVITFIPLSYLFSEEWEVPDRLDVVAIDESSTYSLPSPNELLMAAKKRGVQIDPKKGFTIFKTELDGLAKLSRVEAVFVLGRMFAVAGLSYENLSNENILNLAEKLHKGVRVIKFPDALRDELDVHYTNFLRQPKIERQELIVAFTNSRSSLISLLHDKERVSKEDRESMKTLGVSLELGLWFQSLSLALEQAKGEKQLKAINQIFLMEDILSYFDKTLKDTTKKGIKSPFLNMLLQINQLLQKSSSDGVLSLEERNIIQSRLSTIIY